MIRELEVNELVPAAIAGQRFVELCKLPITIKPQVFALNWATIKIEGKGEVFGAFKAGDLVGGIGCLIHPDLNDGELQAMEGFWWVHPEHRGVGLKLLRRFEDWALSMGAKRVLMGSLKVFEADRMKQMYEKMGYSEIETFWVKGL